MPEEPQQQQATPPGWIAGLPDALKTNAAFTKFNTVGEFANDYLVVSTKASELEGRVSNSIPKLKDGASDAERSQFYDALGRPKDAKEYEFDGEDKNAPEWTSQWKQTFHSLGLTKAQGSELAKKFNGSIQALVDSNNTRLKNEIAEATTKFKSEQGDKFDTNVELAKRLYTKYGDGDFDKAFDAETSAARIPIMRMILKFAALTGEDRSPQSANGTPGKVTGNPFPKSNMQPART